MSTLQRLARCGVHTSSLGQGMKTIAHRCGLISLMACIALGWSIGARADANVAARIMPQAMRAFATTATAFELSADVSGTWFDPQQDGQGLVIEHIDVGGQAQLVVTWFTYLDGEQRWLFGVGPVVAAGADINLSISTGADFPPQFVATTVSAQVWGTLQLRFSSSDAGVATWTSSVAGFNDGSMPLRRLSLPSIASVADLSGITACSSGAWFDPAQNGHGLFVEVLGSGAQRNLLVIWYAYLDGAQRWITALGPIVGNSANLQATITSGADFPPAFRAADVVRENWGSMTFTRVNDDQAQWQWSSNISGFGSGSMNLTRLTALSGRGCRPTDDADAARFLTQATFGPNTSSIATLRSQGMPAWIAAQMAAPATLHRPVIEAQIAAQVLVDPRNAAFYSAYRVERWFNMAATATDQLRQRVAFALSQILVVSDQGTLINHPLGVAEYNDILLRNAFGNYRSLLREVTLSPVMAAFLTSLRNQKTDWSLDSTLTLVPGLIAPDENYAREVMQLFSVGLIERNRDFSPLLINAQTVPTYDQSVVTDTAKVLTGWSYQCTGPATVGTLTINRNCGNCVGTACNFSTNLFFSNPGRYAVSGVVTALAHPDSYRPMVCYPRYADSGRSATAANGFGVLPPPYDAKKILSGVRIEASARACHEGTAGADQQACIDYCTAQIDTLIDTLFLHPNLPPMVARQLIQRLTTSNPTAGYIDRVAAIFENDGAGVRGNLAAVVTAILLDPEARTRAPATSFGKLREPLLRLTALWRAFDVRAAGGVFGLYTPERAYAQRPLGATSVFNFYSPDYQQPGEIADAGLFAPELQILDESTTITTSDDLWRRVFSGYSFAANGTTQFRAPLQGAYLPTESIDALPSTHADLIEALNQKLLFGKLSDRTRGKLQTLLDGDMSGADARRKALDLIHLMVISPEFSLQR